MPPLFSLSGAPNPYLPWPKPQTPSPFSKLGILQLEYVLKSPRWQLYLQVLIRWICLGSGLSVAGPPSAQKVLLLGELMLASGFPCGSADKESAGHVGDLSSIPGLGRSPGEGKGYPLQYSGLENFMDCIVHGVAKSWTQLSDFHSPSSLGTTVSSSCGLFATMPTGFLFIIPAGVSASPPQPSCACSPGCRPENDAAPPLLSASFKAPHHIENVFQLPSCDIRGSPWLDPKVLLQSFLLLPPSRAPSPLVS